MGLDVGENHGAVEDGNGQEVGGTRGEGLLLPSCRAHPPNGQQDQAVGGEDEGSRQISNQGGEDIEDHTGRGCAGTGQAEKGLDVTEVGGTWLGPQKGRAKTFPVSIAELAPPKA